MKIPALKETTWQLHRFHSSSNHVSKVAMVALVLKLLSETLVELSLFPLQLRADAACRRLGTRLALGI